VLTFRLEAAIRIPLGYWAVDLLDYEPYVSGQVSAGVVVRILPELTYAVHVPCPSCAMGQGARASCHDRSAWCSRIAERVGRDWTRRTYRLRRQQL